MTTILHIIFWMYAVLVTVLAYTTLFVKKKVIPREDKIPYLVRYSVFSCSWFAIKVHNILRSDDDCLHDHPWAFLTVILRGGYTEHTLRGKKKFYRAGSILYRHLFYVHRLEVEKPAWTLVITFKKKKKWGFHTPDGWVEHNKYKPTGACIEND